MPRFKTWGSLGWKLLSSSRKVMNIFLLRWSWLTKWNARTFWWMLNIESLMCPGWSCTLCINSQVQSGLFVLRVFVYFFDFKLYYIFSKISFSDEDGIVAGNESLENAGKSYSNIKHFLVSIVIGNNIQIVFYVQVSPA